MTSIVRIALTEELIDLTEHEALVAHQAAGAVVGFSGVVRDHDGGRGVTRLEYSAHPTAAHAMITPSSTHLSTLLPTPPAPFPLTHPQQPDAG